MSKSGKKTADEMNAERRASKQKRRGSGLGNRAEGFSMQAAVVDRYKRDQLVKAKEAKQEQEKAKTAKIQAAIQLDKAVKKIINKWLDAADKAGWKGYAPHIYSEAGEVAKKEFIQWVADGGKGYFCMEVAGKWTLFKSKEG